METTKQKMLDKVAKLLALANDPNASQGEIENATKMANMLMMKHQIEQEDVVLGYSEVDEDEIFVEGGNDGLKVDWRKQLMTHLAWGNMCDVLYNKKRVETYDKDGWFKAMKTIGFKLTLIGSDVNRKIVMQMYKLCVDRLPKLGEQRYKERVEELKEQALGLGLKLTARDFERGGYLVSKKRFINSYIYGAMIQIKNNMRDNIKELAQDDAHKWGLIKVKADDLIKQHIADEHGKVNERTSRKVKVDGYAVSRGKEDAMYLEDRNQLNERN